MSLRENPQSVHPAAAELPESLRAAPIGKTSRQKKTDQKLRPTSHVKQEAVQDKREAVQDTRDVAQDTRETEQDLREAGQEFQVSGQALIESEDRFRLLVENVTDYAIYMLDPEGRIITWNVGAERSKGYKTEEVLGQNYSMFFLPEDAAAGLPARELAAAARQGRYETEVWRRRKDGSRFWAHMIMTAICDRKGELCGFASITRDRTAQREHEQQMESTLKEKEVLLREIHHRVKNNLQVIQSLLRMGIRSLPPGEARAATEKMIERIHAMAMVHERLHNMPDLAGLSLAGYVRDIFAGVMVSNAVRPGQIELRLDAEDILLTVDRAIPFGLLTNELLSNCLKHGFPGGRKGTITVSIHRIPGAVRMIVKDNGIGLPEHFDAGACNSMGLKLTASLAHQLGGSLRFTSDKGCQIQGDLTRL